MKGRPRIRITRTNFLKLVVMALPDWASNTKSANDAEARVRTVIDKLNGSGNLRICIEGEPPCSDCGSETHAARDGECDGAF